MKYFTAQQILCYCVDQLQPNFFKLPCMEQRIKKLYWKSTMYSVVKCPWIFIFILLCLIYSRFLILIIYIINIGYWQVLFIAEEQLGKSYSATCTFKCGGYTAAILVDLVFVQDVRLPPFPYVFWREKTIDLKLSTCTK